MKTNSLLDAGSWDLATTLVAPPVSPHLAETVQELIHIAALASPDDAAPAYFPEGFLTRWL